MKKLHTSLLLFTLGALSALGCWLSWPARAGNPQRGQTAKPPATIKQLPERAKRWALIVGVDDYESSEINRLSGAANDAKALKDALVRYAGFPEEQVILLASDQPDQRKPKYPLIIKYLTNLKGLVPSDGLLLFAFSGHGVERGGRTYLLPADAQSSENIRLLERTALPVDVVKEEIRATGVRQVLIILDSCRNDPSPGKGGGDNRVTDSFIRSFNFDLRNSEIDAFVTLHAASPGQRAYEYAEQKQGYFTWTLIEALRGRAANERGEVTLAGLLGYLEEKTPFYVRRDLGEQQRPYAVIEGYRANDLVLAVTGAPTPIPAPASKPTAIPTPTPKPTPAPTPAVKYAKVAGPSLPLVKMEFTTARVDARGTVTRQPGQSAMSFVEDLGNGVKLEMVEITGGKFLMGAPESEAERGNREMQHEVAVSDFYIGRYEVTQRQWKAVMGILPPGMGDLSLDFKGDDLPVVRVSWDEAKDFISRLNRKLGLSDMDGYRLPSEAQWEYAARAGTTMPFGFGATITPEVVNYDGYYPYGQAPKGQYRQHPLTVGSLGCANAYGLFDMHGNVWEWCEDWYGEYPSGAVTNPTGASAGSFRVVRGGGWYDYAVHCRSAYRGIDALGDRIGHVGFRLVRVGR